MRSSSGFFLILFSYTIGFPASWAALAQPATNPGFNYPWKSQLQASALEALLEQEAEERVQEPQELDKAPPAEVQPGEEEVDDEDLSPREKRKRAGVDPCALTVIKGDAWIDKLNRGLHRAVCASALWFDDLFGDELQTYDDRGTYGRLLLGVEYDDRKEIGEVSRFRAKFDLPNAERRISGFIGRGDREELISDRSPRTGALPNRIEHAGIDEDEWLVGLGYSPPRGSTNHSWSYDVGADLEFPLNWYARARYKHVVFPSNAALIRMRQSFFWEREDGWGLTSKVDYDYLLASERLIRWRNVATFSEGDKGVDWYTELTLFENRGDLRALAYQIAASGETDASVPLEFVLGRVIYRRSILRDWFFLDIRPGVSWRRDEPEEDRELRPMLAIGAEIVFGTRRR